MAKTISTVGISREQWLLERKIGGSTMPKIAGVSNWGTPLDAYNEIKFPLNFIKEPTPQMQSGIDLEPLVRQKFAEVMGLEVIERKEIVLHDDFEYLRANIDGEIQPHRGRGKGLLEIKVIDDRSAHLWYDENGRFTEPLDYRIQTQHYLNPKITGYEYGYIVAFNADRRKWDFEGIKEITPDLDFIKTLEDAAIGFWEYNIMQDIPPEPSNAADAASLFPTHKAGKIEIATGELYEDLMTLKAAKAEEKEIKKIIDSCSDRIKAKIADAETIADAQGNTLATYKASKASKVLVVEQLAQEKPELILDYVTAIDSKRFSFDYPELFEQYAIEKLGSRRFLVK